MRSRSRVVEVMVAASVLVTASASCGRSSSPARDKAPPVAPRDGGEEGDAREVAGERDRSAAVQAALDQMDPPYPPPRALSRKHRRGDCSTKYSPRPARDPTPMCRIEGGTFMFGGGTYLVNGEDGQREVQVPAIETTLRSFYIDQFEVTAAQAAVFLNAHGNVCENGIESPKVKKQAPTPNPCVWIDFRDAAIEQRAGRYAARRGQERWPVYTFSWEGALRYCAWVGKRVPSSAQWEYAACHDPSNDRDLVFPWGDEWVPHAASCNDPLCDPRPPGRTPPGVESLPVGTFDGRGKRADGSSPWGLHDTAGGAAELVFECAEPEATCHAGQPCGCKILTTSSVGAPTLARLRVDHRVDETAWGFGSTGIRCLLAIP